MTTYKYFFTDLITNAYMGSLPLQNVQVTSTLSAAGTFSGDLDLKDPLLRAGLVNLDSIVIPGRTAWWVDRNGILLAGGIVWDDDYDSDSRVYKITGSTFDSYLDHVVINQLLVYTGVDVCSIAVDLWNHAQGGVDGSNIGVIIPSAGSVLAGQLDTEAWDPSQRTFYGSAVQTVSQLQPGFDYYVAVQYDSSGNPQKRLVLGGPYVGAPVTVSGLTFRRPGNVLKYTWPRYWSKSPNRILGTGGGVGQSSVLSEYDNTTLTGAGYPILTDTRQYKNIFDQTTLDTTVRAYGTAVSAGVLTPQLTLNPHANDVIGNFNLGDPCRVIVEPDERFPAGMDTYMRVASINITPQSAGTEEQIQVNLSQAVT